MIAGRATAEGTRRYADRFTAGAGHWRTLDGEVRLSSLGIGTYLGPDDTATDEAYRDAVAGALGRGLNVVDTAINYRHQRSERAVGRALAALVADGTVRRDEVLVATKGGYLPYDGAAPPDRAAWVTETYLQPGIVAAADIVSGVHCMTPRYLRDQIARSRRNLGLRTIDVYYLHNPEEQRAAVGDAEFWRRMHAACETLEAAADAGHIGCYGAATWNGFRQPLGARDGLVLETLVSVARSVGGAHHRFRVVQLPYNLAMTEAFALANQPVGGETVPLLEAARRLGVYVMTSASVYQGQLTRNLPPLVAEFVPGLATDAQRALQFARSTPGVGTALVGMRAAAHVEEDTRVVAAPVMTPEAFARIFQPA